MISISPPADSSERRGLRKGEGSLGRRGLPITRSLSGIPSGQDDNNNNCIYIDLFWQQWITFENYFQGALGWLPEEVNICSRKTYACTSICTSVMTMNRGELESRLWVIIWVDGRHCLGVTITLPLIYIYRSVYHSEPITTTWSAGTSLQRRLLPTQTPSLSHTSMAG